MSDKLFDKNFIVACSGCETLALVKGEELDRAMRDHGIAAFEELAGAMGWVFGELKFDEPVAMGVDSHGAGDYKVYSGHGLLCPDCFQRVGITGTTPAEA